VKRGTKTAKVGRYDHALDLRDAFVEFDAALGALKAFHDAEPVLFDQVLPGEGVNYIAEILVQEKAEELAQVATRVAVAAERVYMAKNGRPARVKAAA
jgi:hypothetical protein